MFAFIQRAPFALELVMNGIFILFYAMTKARIGFQGMPETISLFILDKGKFWVPIVITIATFANLLKSEGAEDFVRRHIFSIIVLIPLYIAWGDGEFIFWLSAVHLFSSILSIYETPVINDDQPKFKFNFYERIKNNPAQIVLATFAATILIGALLLMLPISIAPGQKIQFIDALFMSTSAVCVTGLSSISLADTFSNVGEIIMVILVQIGGLGIMTLSSSLMIFMGRSMGVKDQLLMRDILDITSVEELIALIIDIIRFTFFIELIGALLLTIGFYGENMEFSQAIYWGFFHAISAFCNAGFGLLNNNFENFNTNPIINFTITWLIVMGGIGFIALKDYKELIIHRKKLRDLTLHTKIVSITTIILLGSGTIYIFFSEFLHGLQDYSFWEKLQISWFQSVTTRTAGFNSIPMTSLHSHTIAVMIILMFIGASPGSTGGGIKTSTFAVLFQSLMATLRGKTKVEFFDRRIPESIVLKSTAIFLISLIIVCIGMLLMLRAEPEQPFLYLLFEVVSAFGTVGLSMGITGYLTTLGKLIIIIIMYIGRVGPLTLAVAIGQTAPETGKLEYPEGRILIG